MPKTPPNEPARLLQVEETPVRIHQITSAVGYATGDLERSRDAVMTDLNSLPIIDAKKMLATLFPTAPLSEESIDKILNHPKVASLRRNGLQWNEFVDGPLAANKNQEGFLPLIDIFEAIGDAVHVLEPPKKATDKNNLLDLTMPPRSTKLVIQGQQSPPGSRDNSSMPDAYLQFEDPLHRYASNPNDAWSTAVAAFEFKRENNHDNLIDVRLFFFFHTHVLCKMSPRYSRIQERCYGRCTT